MANAVRTRARAFGRVVLASSWVVSVAACGSAAPPPTTVDVAPDILAEVAAEASSEPTVAASSEPPPRAHHAPASSDGESICAIDPAACAPVDPAMIDKCGCNRLAGRDRQKCVIDCVARERNQIEDQLRRDP